MGSPPFLSYYQGIKAWALQLGTTVQDRNRCWVSCTNTLRSLRSSLPTGRSGPSFSYHLSIRIVWQIYKVLPNLLKRSSLHITVQELRQFLRLVSGPSIDLERLNREVYNLVCSTEVALPCNKCLNLEALCFPGKTTACFQKMGTGKIQIVFTRNL